MLLKVTLTFVLITLVFIAPVEAQNRVLVGYSSLSSNQTPIWGSLRGQATFRVCVFRDSLPATMLMRMATLVPFTTLAPAPTGDSVIPANVHWREALAEELVAKW